jgi:hypothetical protein
MKVANLKARTDHKRNSTEDLNKNINLGMNPHSQLSGAQS